jgi:hypothetical protein
MPLPKPRAVLVKAVPLELLYIFFPIPASPLVALLLASDKPLETPDKPLDKPLDNFETKPGVVPGCV